MRHFDIRKRIALHSYLHENFDYLADLLLRFEYTVNKIALRFFCTCIDINAIITPGDLLYYLLAFPYSFFILSYHYYDLFGHRDMQ